MISECAQHGHAPAVQRMSRPYDCECGACPECVEAQRVHEEFLAWQQDTREGQLTVASLTQRAVDGFQPRDPNAELDALLAADPEMRRLARLSDEIVRSVMTKEGRSRRHDLLSICRKIQKRFKDGYMPTFEQMEHFDACIGIFALQLICGHKVIEECSCGEDDELGRTM